jgi:hypothetical protein
MGPSRNRFSKTDPDATFMRMKDDHMRNGQLKPAYNVQAAVALEYFIGATVPQSRNGSAELMPMLEALKKLGMHFNSAVCDSGYDSEESLAYLKSEGIKA